MLLAGGRGTGTMLESHTTVAAALIVASLQLDSVNGSTIDREAGAPHLSNDLSTAEGLLAVAPQQCSPAPQAQVRGSRSHHLLPVCAACITYRICRIHPKNEDLQAGTPEF